MKHTRTNASWKAGLVALLLAGSGWLQTAGAQVTLCHGSYASDDYTNTNGYTWSNVNKGNGLISPAPASVNPTGNGTIQMVWGGMNFNAVAGGSENRTYRNLPAPGLDNNTWTAEFTFTLNTVTTAARSNGPGHYLVAFTSGTQDPLVQSVNTTGICGSGLQAYPYTNQNAIWASLTQDDTPVDPTTDNYTNGKWYFTASSKYGATAPITPVARIPFPTTGTNSIFYIRLQRTWGAKGMLRVFTDPSMSATSELHGSPLCFDIDPRITGLNVMQHGVAPWGACSRVLNCTLSHMEICNVVSNPLTLTPIINGPTTFCAGAPVGCNGSGSQWSPLPPSTFIWSIVRVDANGNAIPGYSWSQGYVYDKNQSVTHNLDGYAFPSAANGGPNFLQCGYKYVITLVLQNCGNSYAAGYETISIACPPTVNPGSNQTICPGSNTSIGNPAPVGTNWTYAWTPTTGLSSPTSPVTNVTNVTSPVTYTLTVTDPATGCSSSGTVNIGLNNYTNYTSEFGLTANLPGGSGFGTMAATPTTPNATITGAGPNYGYAWWVEMLNSSNVVVCSAQFNPSNWWNNFSTNNFPGYTSSAPNNCNVNISIPENGGGNKGSFAAGYTYRVTRSVWNGCTSSTTIHTALLQAAPPQGGGCNNCRAVSIGEGAYEIGEGETVIRPMTSTLENVINSSTVEKTEGFAIAPNPNSGSFTLSIENQGQEYTYELYDVVGRLLISSKSTESNLLIEMPQSNKGMYILKVNLNGQLFAKRVIQQ